MSKLVVANANDFIEKQLDAGIAAIENLFDAEAISFIGPLTSGVDDIFRTAIETKAKIDASNRARRDKIAILLTTAGGYIETVQRIVETIRHHYKTVDYIIPNYAFSAGTVMVMSGDAIHMDYFSRLGPIDPQVGSKNRGGMVPALGYLEQYQRLIKKAEAGKITPAEVQLLVDGFDQAELYQYEQARELSITLLKDWLVKYKFKNWVKTQTRGIKVTPEMRKKCAERIAKELNKTQKWHSHGRGISKDVLINDLGLLIDDFGSNPDTKKIIRDYHDLLNDYMSKTNQRGAIHFKDAYIPFM